MDGDQIAKINKEEGIKYYCLGCDTELKDFEPKFCCSGLQEQCGCMGLPIDPPICDKECWERYMNKKNINKDQKQEPFIPNNE